MPIARPVTTAFSGGGCGHAGGFPGGKRFFPKGPGCGTFLMDSRGHPNLPFSPIRAVPFRTWRAVPDFGQIGKFFERRRQHACIYKILI